MQPAEKALSRSPVPLIVDVDGTLIRGDLLAEGVARLAGTRPLKLLALPFWLARGRAGFKRRLAEAAPVEPASLVLEPSVTARIAAAQAEGRPVYLASASDERLVAPLAAFVGADGHFASDGCENLAGAAKARALSAAFGAGGFDYVGDERRDLAVWKAARHAIAVGAGPGFAAKVRAVDPDAEFLPARTAAARDYLRALRPHQWIKNLLVFAPMAAAHVADAPSLLAATIAFFALSFCASGTYVFNDILDLPHDRAHPTKRHRPLASGRLPVIPAAALAVAMIVTGLAGAFAVSASLAGMIAAYLAITAAYSLHLKRKTFIDVVTLATLYTVRVLAGAVAVSVAISHWFLAFSIFIFLALAIVKRLRELIGLRIAGQDRSSGRSYAVEDLPVLAALAGASSFAAVLVLALYINSPQVGAQYTRPDMLWLLCPLLLYWLGRIVLLANRGLVDDDPVVFAVRDRASRLVAFCAIAVFAAAL